MKTRILFTMMILTAIVAHNYAQTNNFKRYQLESGIVEYEVTGMQNGLIILYFDDYGMREASYENTILEMFGVQQETNTVNYLDGYWQYNVNVTTKTGTKTKNTMLESIVENGNNTDLEEVGMEMFVSMGGKQTGEESFMGKTCEVWTLESMGTTMWIWKGVPLKTETNMMGILMNRRATMFEENVSIPPEKLNIPDDIIFNEVDLDNIQNMMNGYQD